MNYLTCDSLNINKYDRKSVPKALKDRLWDTTFGPEAGQGECFVCGILINSKRFEAGHIKAVYNGGDTNLENLKCICSTCNKSMGTQNLEEFKKTYFPAIMKNKSYKSYKSYKCDKCGYHSPSQNDESTTDLDFKTKLSEVSLDVIESKISETLVLDDDEYEDYVGEKLKVKLKNFDKYKYSHK